MCASNMQDVAIPVWKRMEDLRPVGRYSVWVLPWIFLGGWTGPRNLKVKERRRQEMRLPGFSAEASVETAINVIVAALRGQPNLRGRVVSAGTETVNCNCGGGGTNPNQGPPGVCACSSIAGVGCSNTGNQCNPGFTPQCSCGLLGNSCQCVPSAQ